MMRPLEIEVMSTPAIIGVSIMPACVGLTPFTTCRYSGMKVTEPNSAKPMIKPTAQQIAKTRLVKRRRGRIGSAATCSAAMNPASAASVPVARPSEAGEVQAIV